MKIRVKLCLSLCLAFVILTLGVYTLSTRLLMQSYLRLEREDTQEDTRRVRDVLIQAGVSLEEKSPDWAYWNDTYEFMRDGNKAYIKSNLIDTGLLVMKTDLIFYIRPDKHLFFSFGTKRFFDLPIPASREVMKQCGIDLLKPDEEKSGIVLTSAAPAFVAMRSILTTEKKGPSRGWLVFVRYLDAAKLKSIASDVHLEFKIIPVGSPLLSSSDQKALQTVSHSDLIPTRPLDEQQIVGYTLIRDVMGQPALLIRMTEPRTIYQQGKTTILYVTRLFLIFALVLAIVVFLVLETSVLSRLTLLTHQVEKIGEGGTAITRVALRGSDELGHLAGRVNGMLAKLERTTLNLEKSQAQLQEQNFGLEDTIQERTRQLLHQAMHDALTGLANRAFLMNRLQQIQQCRETTLSPLSPSQSSLAVCFLDLDNFKTINDTLGHEAGDELLRETALRLLACVSQGDTVVRLGGDEFVLLIESLSAAEESVAIAERIMAAMSKAFSLPGGDYFSSFSLGIAYTEERNLSPDVLLRDADTAMYHAKANGKARYSLFEPSMNDRLTERIELEIGLRQALEREEFQVHYQPLIDLKTGMLIGAEALVRWERPGEGLVSPGRFIPIAEETGLIIPLGYWVMERACGQAKEWRDTFDAPLRGGRGFTISVNLSGKQLRGADVVDRIRDILERTGLPAEALKVEITESIMITDIEDAIIKLKCLKAMGVKLAIDDFGTGYSSMATLSAFPFDTVKIDRAFVSRLGDHPEATAVIQAIITLSTALSMDVTGEGIETIQQLTDLQKLGCSVGQGYYFARPLDTEAMEQHLTEQLEQNLVLNLPQTCLPKAA